MAGGSFLSVVAQSEMLLRAKTRLIVKLPTETGPPQLGLIFAGSAQPA
jgi:hypothetical protein